MGEKMTNHHALVVNRIIEDGRRSTAAPWVDDDTIDSVPRIIRVNLFNRPVAQIFTYRYDVCRKKRRIQIENDPITELDATLEDTKKYIDTVLSEFGYTLFDDWNDEGTSEK